VPVAELVAKKTKETSGLDISSSGVVRDLPCFLRQKIPGERVRTASNRPGNRRAERSRGAPAGFQKDI